MAHVAGESSATAPAALQPVDRTAAYWGEAHRRFYRRLSSNGGLFETIIDPTVRAFTDAQVGRVLPAHCTGWKAVHALAHAMPSAFVQPAVGTLVSF